MRALAVTAVVLFHYKVDFIPGGFVGVDVISGYLMTCIIMRRLAEGSFTVRGFYADRGRRIIPGLLGLCFGLLAAGYFVLEPGAYQTLGSTAIGALLFVSNFQFWEGTSYFNPESANSWLLHSWSLSKSRPDLNTLGSGVEAVITEAISLEVAVRSWYRLVQPPVPLPAARRAQPGLARRGQRSTARHVLGRL